MAAATHTGLLAGITDPVNRLRLENYEAEAYYNSGVLLMDLTAMRREVRPADIFDYAREHADILLLPDQDVLNGLYGGQILGVDDSLWNYDARRFDRYLLVSQGEKDMDCTSQVYWLWHSEKEGELLDEKGLAGRGGGFGCGGRIFLARLS